MSGKSHERIYSMNRETKESQNRIHSKSEESGEVARNVAISKTDNSASESIAQVHERRLFYAASRQQGP